MALLYPHKQTVLIALICIVVVGAAGYSAYGSTWGGRAEPSTVTISEDPASEAQPQIEANDDWKKAFLDASNAASVSPSKQAPNEGAGPTTVTDRLGINFFAKYMDLKQANLLNNPDIVNQTVDDLVTSNFDSIQPKEYTLGDLTVTSSSDEATLSAFATGVARAVGSYSAPEGEGVIIQKYISTSDPQVLTELDQVITSYKRVLKMLLALKTPEIAANDELDLVNSVSALEFAAESLRSTDNDNIRGLAGASLHVQGINLLLSALSNVNDDLEIYGVSLKLDSSVFNTMLN